MATARRQPETPLEWALGAAAFAVELAFWAACAVIGWSLASGLGIVAGAAGAVALLAASVGVWAVWMAPTSPRRLALAPRLILAFVLLAAAGVGLYAVGHTRAGITLATLGPAIMTAAYLTLERPRT